MSLLSIMNGASFSLKRFGDRSGDPAKCEAFVVGGGRCET